MRNVNAGLSSARYFPITIPILIARSQTLIGISIKIKNCDRYRDRLFNFSVNFHGSRANYHWLKVIVLKYFDSSSLVYFLLGILCFSECKMASKSNWEEVAFIDFSHR
jgi:hypothetical protein